MANVFLLAFSIIHWLIILCLPNEHPLVTSILFTPILSLANKIHQERRNAKRDCREISTKIFTKEPAYFIVVNMEVISKMPNNINGPEDNGHFGLLPTFTLLVPMCSHIFS
jgi:hypothetical protein